MLWVKAFHIIFMVSWFAGLFYLPRLMVYHTEATDPVSLERFKVMERRLYYQILLPSALLATFFGGWLLIEAWPLYAKAGWMHAKLALVIALWGMQGYCGSLVRQFRDNRNKHSARFYRILNEVPTLLLILIILLVVVKPGGSGA